MTREQLEESLYAWGDEVESNAIEVFIYQLRRKLAATILKQYVAWDIDMNLPESS